MWHLGDMGSGYPLFLKAVSVLLAVATSEAKHSSASCLPCSKTAGCHNSTHCVCEIGFELISGTNICQDIDECATGIAKCKQISYCRNKVGHYICSCLKFAIFSWVAGLVEIDQPDCYEEEQEEPSSQVDTWEELRINTTKKDFATKVTQLLQHVEQFVWKDSYASPRKGEISKLNMVYETKRCHNKTVLEAGNNMMVIDCTFKGAKERDENSVAFITYKSLGKFLDESFFTPRRGMQAVELNSHIVSGTIGTEIKVNLPEPVFLTFQHTKPGRVKAKYFCVYWKRQETGSWSTEGCSHVGSNDSYTTCKCSHLSSFAVLMTLSPEEDFVLSVITYVGLSLSLLCLLLAALTFLLCRAIQNTSTTLHLQLSLCLFLAHLLFLTGINRTEPEELCSAIAGMLHYLYLAAFMWMLLEGLHLFLTVRNLKVANYTSSGRFKKRFMYPAGYGIPACIVAVSASLGHESYGTHAYCWLSLDKGFIWSFMGPVAVIILINMVFYFQIMWILRSKLSSLNKEVSTIQDTKVMTFKVAVQVFVLGCSWGIGFFMMKEVGKTFGLVFAYLFTIINVLQGVLLFVVHCLLNHQVRMEYKKWFKGKQKGVETESAEMSRSTTHTKMEEPEKPSEFLH